MFHREIGGGSGSNQLYQLYLNYWTQIVKMVINNIWIKEGGNVVGFQKELKCQQIEISLMLL